MQRKDFYDIAIDDYRFLLHNRNTNYYNNIVVICQQVAEKLLKSVLVAISPDAKEYMNSHNLRQIYLSIKRNDSSIDLNIGELSILKDYYFEARYPGESYMDITKDQTESAFNTVYDVLIEVNKWRKNKGLPIVEVGKNKELSTVESSMFKAIESMTEN